ncbi:hypothetical protein ACLOJK_037041 [Asimina triloba]
MEEIVDLCYCQRVVVTTLPSGSGHGQIWVATSAGSWEGEVLPLVHGKERRVAAGWILSSMRRCCLDRRGRRRQSDRAGEDDGHRRRQVDVVGRQCDVAIELKMRETRCSLDGFGFPVSSPMGWTVPINRSRRRWWWV